MTARRPVGAVAVSGRRTVLIDNPFAVWTPSAMDAGTYPGGIPDSSGNSRPLTGGSVTIATDPVDGDRAWNGPAELRSTATGVTTGVAWTVFVVGRRGSGSTSTGGVRLGAGTAASSPRWDYSFDGSLAYRTGNGNEGYFFLSGHTPSGEYVNAVRIPAGSGAAATFRNGELISSTGDAFGPATPVLAVMPETSGTGLRAVIPYARSLSDAEIASMSESLMAEYGGS